MDRLLIKVIRLVPDKRTGEEHQKFLTESRFYIAGEQLTEKEIQQVLTDSFHKLGKDIKIEQ